MSPEMADEIDDEAEKHGMKTSKYIRQVLREHQKTPFPCDETVLFADENGEKPRNEGRPNMSSAQHAPESSDDSSDEESNDETEDGP